MQENLKADTHWSWLPTQNMWNYSYWYKAWEYSSLSFKERNTGDTSEELLPAINWIPWKDKKFPKATFCKSPLHKGMGQGWDSDWLISVEIVVEWEE